MTDSPVNTATNLIGADNMRKLKLANIMVAWEKDVLELELMHPTTVRTLPRRCCETCKHVDYYLPLKLGGQRWCIKDDLLGCEPDNFKYWEASDD